ncbi:TetR/AcrR family transcriptional regulator [Streptomyces sp. NPDC056161]|uniref:TetR/AcrR family transcriptional regulator n=1 Tax=Streptomyces sp. NPDC056161 TaxID=3345732 RepID=UPI0035DBDFCA
MARPRSEERRNTILSAATRVIASQGLGASTAVMAKEAGVSNGSLFVYFDTKTALLNELYVALKTEMGQTAVAGLPTESDPREQLRHMWTQWARWATAHPHKRRALAQLQVADDITAESHQAAHAAMAGIAHLLEQCRADGPRKDVPLGFLLPLINAIAEATIDAMIREPDSAEARSQVTFDAMWQILTGSGATDTA